VSGVRREVVIDCFGEERPAYCATHAIVVVDVIRATTTLVTAAARGRRCFPAESLDGALDIAAQLDEPVLAGELGGSMPYGFEVNNSPAEFAVRNDLERPLVLLSTSGTRLLMRCRGAPALYAGCLRNWSAQVDRLANHAHSRVALIGAQTRGEFRLEDQVCCAWIAGALIERGFAPVGEKTEEIVERLRGAPASIIANGHSAGYLRGSGQLADLEFVLEHVDDVDRTFTLDGNELLAEQPSHPRS
jgi:2-phosphosulfolactate phosphatase